MSEDPVLWALNSMRTISAYNPDKPPTKYLDEAEDHYRSLLKRLEEVERWALNNSEAMKYQALWCNENYEEVKELRTKLEEAERELYDLRGFHGDIMAGCDIKRNGRLYRQVEIVVGMGRTVDEEELDNCCANLNEVNLENKELRAENEQLKGELKMYIDLEDYGPETAGDK